MADRERHARGSGLDAATLTNLVSDRDRLIRELDAYAKGERSIAPTDADIATMEARLALLSRLIERQTRSEH